MSWREVLGVANTTEPIYTHNPHKCLKPDNSADIADIAERDSKLLEALAGACQDLLIAPIEVRDALAPEDVECWANGDISTDTLAAC